MPMGIWARLQWYGAAGQAGQAVILDPELEGCLEWPA